MPQRTILAADGTPYRWERASAPTPEDHLALSRFRAWTQKGGPVPAGVDPKVWALRRRDYLEDRRRTAGGSPALDREIALQNDRLNAMRELGSAGFLKVPNRPPKPSAKPLEPPYDPATASAGVLTPQENARRAAVREARRRAPFVRERRVLLDQLDAVRRAGPFGDGEQSYLLGLLRDRLENVEGALAGGASLRLSPLAPRLTEALKAQINRSTQDLDRVDDAAKNAIPGGSGGIDYALEKRLKANSMALLGWKAGAPKVAPPDSAKPATPPAKPAAPAPNAAPERRATPRNVAAEIPPKAKPPRGGVRTVPAPSVPPAPNRPMAQAPTARPLRDVSPNAWKAEPVFSPTTPVEPRSDGSRSDGSSLAVPKANDPGPGKRPLAASAPFVPLWLRPERIAPNDAPPLVLAPDHPLIAAKNLKGLEFDPVLFRLGVLQKGKEIPTHLVDADDVAKANASLGLFPSDEERAAQREARENPYRTLSLSAASVPVGRALGLTPQDGSLLDPKSRAFAKLTAAVRAGGALSTRRDDLRAQVAESGGADGLYPLLRRDPDIGNATTAGLVGRAVSGALSPVSTARVLLGDSRRDDELAGLESVGYGFADLIAGGFGSLAEKGALGLGKMGAIALERAAAKGFLKGAARQAVERGFARAMAAQASRSLGRKVLRRAWGAAVENGILQSAPVVGQASDRTRANGRPFLQNLREGAGEAGRGLARLFDPRTLFDRDASAHERAMTALNLGLLLFGAGAKGYGSYRERARRGGVDPRYVDLVVRAGRADGERAGGGGPGPGGEGPLPPAGGAPKEREVHRDGRGREIVDLNQLSDDLYATPPVIVVAPDAGGLWQITEYLFGKPLGAEEVADLMGAPGGSTVAIETKLGALSVAIRHKELDIDIQRLFWRSKGKSYVDGKLFAVKKAPSGTGLVIFDRQVKRSIEYGLELIDIYAAGDLRTTEEWNGYYTWARFGFNRALDPIEIARLKRDGFDAKDVHELFQLEGGREWWLEHGEPGEMEFDLREGSLSRKLFERYKMEKGLTR